jgi:hypothetical protein
MGAQLERPFSFYPTFNRFAPSRGAEIFKTATAVMFDNIVGGMIQRHE